MEILSTDKSVCQGNVKAAHENKAELIFGFVGCFGFNGPLRQYFSLYRTVSQRERERERERKKEERNDRRKKNVQTTPIRTYCKCSRPLPYYNPN